MKNNGNEKKKKRGKEIQENIEKQGKSRRKKWKWLKWKEKGRREESKLKKNIEKHGKSSRKKVNIMEMKRKEEKRKGN